MGVDPYLQRMSYTHTVRILSGFAARVRQGKYGRGRTVQTCTVSSAITAVGQTIALACGANPTKLGGSEKLLPRLQQIMDGWRKEDPPTHKMLPVEADVPEFLVNMALTASATECERAIGDLAVIAFYYLLRVGEYTVKGSRNNTKQTVQFKLEDITFFRKNTQGELRCIPRNSPDHIIMTADGATMKLDNQKNGWKGVCVYHEHNGEPLHCPVRALGRRCRHMQLHGATQKTFLSAYWVDNIQYNVTAEDMSRGLKMAASALRYPTHKGIPIERINTHSLRSGGANALALNGYSDTQIQKMGRWRGATFKEYIREELACYAAGMSTNMKHRFNFVNIAGNAFREVDFDTLDIQ